MVLAAALTPLVTSGASASSGTVTAYNHMGLKDPTAISAHGKYVWVADRSGTSANGQVVRVNAATGAHLSITSPLITQPSEIVSDGSYVWVVNATSQNAQGVVPGSLVRIDIKNGKVSFVTHLSFTDSPSELAIGGKYLWLIDDVNWSLLSVNRATLAVTSRTSDLFSVASALSADSRYLWIARDVGGPLGRGSLTRLTLATGALHAVNSPYFNDAVTITSNGKYVWMPASNHVIVRVTIATNKVIKISSKSFDTSLSIGSSAKYAYVASVSGDPNGHGGAVTQVGAGTNSVHVITNRVLTSPVDIAVLGSSVWAINSSFFTPGHASTDLLVRIHT